MVLVANFGLQLFQRKDGIHLAKCSPIYRWWESELLVDAGDRLRVISRSFPDFHVDVEQLSVVFELNR